MYVYAHEWDWTKYIMTRHVLVATLIHAESGIRKEKSRTYVHKSVNSNVYLPCLEVLISQSTQTTYVYMLVE